MRQDVIDLYDDFTHQRIGRRAFMDRLTKLAGSAAAAAAMLKLLMPDYARAAIVAEDDPRVTTERVEIPQGPRGYLARPSGSAGPLPGVVIVHENRGLNPHIEDVARRAAAEGFLALAPDFLTSSGGTPSDPEKAREMIGALSAQTAVADAQRSIAWLAERPASNGKVGIVGFCWGGGIVGEVAAAEPELDAAVVFYGRTPPLEAVPNIKASLLLHYAGLDERINAGVPGFREALDRAGVPYELHTYEGANHAFHNDTSEARYAPDAAKLAWERTVAFLKKELA
ncbi:MAG TPA: dienelactone hydrolase family protein [Alphaproteobacteria bacterium]|nr:dienelactone hydrolase family protein [Alphaproteobacteria bacterium]